MNGCSLITLSLVGSTLAFFNLPLPVHAQESGSRNLIETRELFSSSNRYTKFSHQSFMLNERPRCQSGDPPGCKKFHFSQAAVLAVAALDQYNWNRSFKVSQRDDGDGGGKR